MAVTNYFIQPTTTGSINQWRPSWLAVPNGNTGQPLTMVGSFADRTIQITGTFGAAGSVQIEGSNDGGTTWAILTDPLGNTLVFTSAGMKQITELPAQIRCNVTAGDGSTALNAYLFMHRVRD